jgi:hypothetical protein
VQECWNSGTIVAKIKETALTSFLVFSISGAKLAKNYRFMKKTHIFVPKK